MERYASPIVGRLIALPTSQGGVAALDPKTRPVAVGFDFPAMPDTIDLARSTDYYVTSPPTMPDGMHQYRGTKPLEIPLSFKLHAMDLTYCRYGSLTLLQLAARLHSFVLPITSNNQPATAQVALAKDYVKTTPATVAQGAASPAAGADTESQQVQNSASLNTPVAPLTNSKQIPFPPVTCFLSLIYVSENQPGISCVGYIKDVRVRLMGPWLRGSNGEFNLPSAGEYEFTFVHHPAHSNDYGLSVTQTGDYASALGKPEIQAYATDVRLRLFNTRNLTMESSAGYHGDTTANPPPAAQPPTPGTTAPPTPMTYQTSTPIGPTGPILQPSAPITLPPEPGPGEGF